MGFWPETVPLQVDDGTDSPALDAILRGPAAALTAVALVVGDAARSSGWGAQAALALARRWPRGRRLILADLDLERPALHELTGVTSDEGLADIIDFGASLHRVAVPVSDGEFYLLPGGPSAGEASVLLESDVWTRILRETAARRETLLLYVPANAAGLPALLQRLGAVLVFAEQSEASAVVDGLPHAYAVLAVVTPPADVALPGSGHVQPPAMESTASAGPVSDESFERIRLPTEPVARQELMAELRERQRAARMESPPGVDVAPAEAEAPDVMVPAGASDAAREARTEAAADDVALETIVPAAGPQARRPRRYRHPLWWTLMVVLLASLVGGAWHFLWRRAPEPEVAAPEPVAPPPQAPVVTQPPGTALEYSVAMEAHQNLATAFERLDALSVAHPDLPFYIAPLERSGALYYHVMAGPIADSSGAAAMRDTLVARRIKTAALPNDVRHTPLALLIGDYSARDGAAGQVDELRRLDIPSYVVVGVAADSQPLYRVYVGAFAGPAEADVVRRLLRAAGIRDTLVNRTRSSTP